MQIIEAVFSAKERADRLKFLGNPTVEELGTTPTIYVLRRNGLRLGVGFSIDVAIADAESNLQSYIPKQLKGKGKYAGKAAKIPVDNLDSRPAKKGADNVVFTINRKQA